jgi:hypothetical protein
MNKEIITLTIRPAKGLNSTGFYLAVFLVVFSFDAGLFILKL